LLDDEKADKKMNDIKRDLKKDVKNIKKEFDRNFKGDKFDKFNFRASAQIQILVSLLMTLSLINYVKNSRENVINGTIKRISFNQFVNNYLAKEKVEKIEINTTLNEMTFYLKSFFLFIFFG